MARAHSQSNGGISDRDPEHAPLVAIVDGDASVRQSTDRARASDEEERHARPAGAIEFLRKPPAEARLRQAIENLIAAPARGARNGDGGS